MYTPIKVKKSDTKWVWISLEVIHKTCCSTMYGTRVELQVRFYPPYPIICYSSMRKSAMNACMQEDYCLTFQFRCSTSKHTNVCTAPRPSNVVHGAGVILLTMPYVCRFHGWISTHIIQWLCASLLHFYSISQSVVCISWVLLACLDSYGGVAGTWDRDPRLDLPESVFKPAPSLWKSRFTCGSSARIGHELGVRSSFIMRLCCCFDFVAALLSWFHWWGARFTMPAFRLYTHYSPKWFMQ